MKNRLQKHHRIFGIVGGIVAIIVAMIYLSVTPDEAMRTSGFQQAVLLYGHSACWFILGAASFLWAVKKKNKWSKPLAYAALATYIIFMSTLLMTKMLNPAS